MRSKVSQLNETIIVVFIFMYVVESIGEARINERMSMMRIGNGKTD